MPTATGISSRPRKRGRGTRPTRSDGLSRHPLPARLTWVRGRLARRHRCVERTAALKPSVVARQIVIGVLFASNRVTRPGTGLGHLLSERRVPSPVFSDLRLPRPCGPADELLSVPTAGPGDRRFVSVCERAARTGTASGRLRVLQVWPTRRVRLGDVVLRGGAGCCARSCETSWDIAARGHSPRTAAGSR